VYTATDGRPSVGVVGRGFRRGPVAGEQVAGKAATDVAGARTTTARATAVAGRQMQPEKANEIAVVGQKTERHAGDQRQFGGQGQQRR